MIGADAYISFGHEYPIRDIIIQQSVSDYYA